MRCDVEWRDLKLNIAGRQWTVPWQRIKGPQLLVGSPFCEPRLYTPDFLRSVGQKGVPACVLGIPFTTSFILALDGEDGEWEAGIAERAVAS